MILHSVFFYFKENTPAFTAENMQADILEALAGISVVDEIWAGPPQGINRDVVDNDYAMSLHARFDDLEALQTYQADPTHVEFVEKYKPWFEKIKVYDSRIA